MKRKFSRRDLLRGAAGTALAALQAPSILRAQERRLRVSTFGGYFERMFAEHIYPAFTKASGIAVQSVEQSEGAQFVFQLAEANKAGKPPMDVCCAGEIDVLRGRGQALWRVLDAARMPNLSLLPAEFVGDSHAGLDSVGAMSWYMTLVVNPQEFERLPDSWSVLWGQHLDSWGVMSGSQSPIFEIAAKLFFGGNDALMHKEGITAVIGKIAEIKHNVKLWWQDEGSMQTALTNEDVLGGTYMHDTAIVMSRNGSPVRSLFPKEGAVSSTNYWCQPTASVRRAEAEEFINFCCSPQAQELIARHVGSAPLLPRSRLRLTDREFAAVSSPIPSIPTAAQARYKFSDHMERQFIRMVTS
ncbi:MAG: extracellular solute-binding protein [Pseudomonadota bacterium]|nr:extracellular solute-binding protein [Pseudomonadota bacterium]